MFPIWLRISSVTRSFSSQIYYPMASCLGFRSSVWKYRGNCCFHLILGTRIRVSLLFFLFWTPALLQDPIASSDPKLLCSYFHLCAFMRSFSGHRAPFWALSLSFYLKQQPNRFVLDVVGGEGLQLRQRRDRVWKPKWFYVKNQSRSLPSITPGPPIQWPEWNKKPVDES